MRKDLVLDLLCSSRLSTSLHPAMCPRRLTLCPAWLRLSCSLLWLGLVSWKYQQEKREWGWAPSLPGNCGWVYLFLKAAAPIRWPSDSSCSLSGSHDHSSSTCLSDLPTTLQIVPPLNSPLLPVWVGHLSLSFFFFCLDPNWFRGLDYPDLVMRTRNVWTSIICGMLDSDQVLSP